MNLEIHDIVKKFILLDDMEKLDIMNTLTIIMEERMDWYRDIRKPAKVKVEETDDIYAGKIVFSPKVVATVTLMMQELDSTEWGAQLIASRDPETGTFLVSDIVMIPVVTSTTEVLQLPELMGLGIFDEYREYLKDTGVYTSSILMHSHHRMGAFHSSTDTHEIRERLEAGHKFILSFVFSSDELGTVTYEVVYAVKEDDKISSWRRVDVFPTSYDDPDGSLLQSAQEFHRKYMDMTPIISEKHELMTRAERVEHILSDEMYGSVILFLMRGDPHLTSYREMMWITKGLIEEVERNASLMDELMSIKDIIESIIPCVRVP